MLRFLLSVCALTLALLVFVRLFPPLYFCSLLYTLVHWIVCRSVFTSYADIISTLYASLRLIYHILPCVYTVYDAAYQSTSYIYHVTYACTMHRNMLHMHTINTAPHTVIPAYTSVTSVWLNTRDGLAMGADVWDMGVSGDGTGSMREYNTQWRIFGRLRVCCRVRVRVFLFFFVDVGILTPLFFGPTHWCVGLCRCCCCLCCYCCCSCCC